MILTRASYQQLEIAVGNFGKHLGREPQFDGLTRRVSSATVNKDRRSLLCLWRHAADRELAGVPPKLPKAKEPRSLPHTFTVAQVTQLINATSRMSDPAFWRSLVLCLYDTGARISALLQCRIADVSFQNRTLLLAAEHAKTLTAQMLSISKETAAAIAAQTLRREPEELVWPWRCQHRRLFLQFRRLATLAGVPLPKGKCFHSLRRTTATLIAVNPRLGLEIASRQLGHSTTAVTRLYVGLDQQQSHLLRIADHLPRP